MALLFSYGTLREESVQQKIFGRTLSGRAATLVGFELTAFTVNDPAFVVTSGRRDHSNLRRTGDAAQQVRGIAYDVSDAELAMADAYEPAGYRRVEAQLATGETAWVYLAVATPT